MEFEVPCSLNMSRSGSFSKSSHFYRKKMFKIKVIGLQLHDYPLINLPGIVAPTLSPASISSAKEPESEDV